MSSYKEVQVNVTHKTSCHLFHCLGKQVMTLVCAGGDFYEDEQAPQPRVLYLDVLDILLQQ